MNLNPSTSGDKISNVNPGPANGDKLDSAIPLAGDYPYTRGIYKEMYNSKPWTIRQYAGYGSPQETNQRFKKLISQGASGLSLAFDLPTQIGLDPDDILSKGEVGRVGVTISTLADMRTVFEGIDLKNISTSMTINASAPILLLMYEIVAREKGLNSSEIRGTLQNDILKEFISRGTQIFPLDPSVRLLAETVEYICQNLPNFNAISISGYHMAEAGATPAQELGYTFSNAIAYIDYLIARGVEIDTFAPQISFFFVSSINILETVSKFRAARTLWAELLKDKYSAKNEKSLKLKFHTQTAGVELTAQDPEINLIRTTLQTLAAVLGGAQSIHTNAYDEALGLPTENAARLAVRTQQVILHESAITSHPDPLGGSYLLEDLTKKILQESRDIIYEVEVLGGALKAIESEFISKSIDDSALKYAASLENGNKSIVGVNIHQNSMEFDYTPLEVDKEVEAKAIEMLIAHKSRRDNSEVTTKLANLAKVAESTQNTLGAIKEAIIQGATVGEIVETLKNVWGRAFKEEESR